MIAQCGDDQAVVEFLVYPFANEFEILVHIFSSCPVTMRAAESQLWSIEQFYLLTLFTNDVLDQL